MKRPALTLIEVVAALALLATVVASVLVAQTRSMQQIRQADQRRKAAELAESLLTQWRLNQTALDSPAQGTFSEEGWSWKRQVERERVSLGRDFTSQRPEMLRIHLTVLRERQSSPPIELAAVDWLEPVARKAR